MAKKKKQTRSRKKAIEEPAESSTFWPLSGAILLFVVALFALLGGFGTGGTLPVGMFHGLYWTLGWMAYFTPVALVYWGVYKFQSEDKRIPLANLLSMVAVLAFGAGLLFSALAP